MIKIITNKDIVYDKLNEDYRYLEGIMGNIYDGKLKYEKILPALGELAQKKLNIQKHLAGEAQLLIS